MNIHVIRGDDVEVEIYEKVLELLNAINGYFIFSNFKNAIQLPQVNILQWAELFQLCKNHRAAENISENEFVFILTNKPNERNFFGFVDPETKNNGFVHAGDWEKVIQCPAEIPIAYHIIALLIQRILVKDLNELKGILHDNPIGCINDFCVNKKEVILKMRTADICMNCMEKLTKNLNPPAIGHVFELLESLRIKMLFSQNMLQHLRPSNFEITPDYRIIIPNFGNLEIKLPPIERTLYLFFCRYPEGIFVSELYSFKNELYEIYLEISSQSSLIEMRNSIDDLCNITTNSLNEKLSKIKASFERALGKTLASNYYISGERTQKKKIKILSINN